ncbi:hypothetical protein ACFP2T_35350 [Plantactinospora solaniradicis]|uniref:Uncharacterized protein n=1 Tax=Plantactinospora solaniradicis TaxID=1723736 RepID=A0ABW1KK00_9ACTN
MRVVLGVSSPRPRGCKALAYRSILCGPDGIELARVRAIWIAARG